MSDWNPTPPPYPPPTGEQPTVPPPPAGPAPVPGTPAPSPKGQGRTVLIAVGATLVAVAVIGGAFLLGRSGGDDAADTTTTMSTTSTTTTTSASTTTTTVPPSSAVGDVRSLPDGLYCRDLKAQGYSYSAAVDYWRVHGQPNRMDEDRNGIPCETVYPRSDVVAYWPSSTYEAIPSYGLPSGLLCQDLADRGIDVYGALTYFIWEGYPARMDADGNGIPCETVYPDATEVWLFEF